MFQLVYTSMARSLFGKADIEHIVAVSREKNLQHGITGVLLYKSGSIVQILEGEEADVRQLYANIQKDRRHLNVALIYTQTMEKREFPEWTMGFNCVEVEWVHTPPDGFNPVFHRLDNELKVSGRGTAMLRTFVQTIR